MLSGCGSPADFQGYRRLSIKHFTTTRTRSEAVVTVTVEVESNLDDVNATFHDIVVVGYSGSGEVLCSREVGQMGPREPETVQVSCSDHPELITFEATESVCNQETVIEKLEYSDGRGWVTGVRECGEDQR